MAYFSTDWSQQPVPDEELSALHGRQINQEGKSLLSFGGTFMQRGAMPGMELNRHGYDNHLSWSFRVADDGHIESMDTEGNYHSPDIWYSQRWMHKDAADQVRRARAAGQIVIADLDDGFGYLPKSNVAFHSTHPDNNPDFNRVHYYNMLRECDLVTVSTAALARDMEVNKCKRVAVVRNCIDLEIWRPHDPNKPGMIGWIGGVEWRAADLAILKPFLPDFLEDYGFPFYHGGNSPKPEVPRAWTQAGIDPDKIKCVTAPLCAVSEYHRLWDPMGLALVPLENHPFNHRKSFLKGLEASACGIPFVYSNKMPEYDVLGAGIPADNARPKTWRAALEDLLDDDFRRAEGARNRKAAEQWDIHDKWTQWDDAYQELIRDVSSVHV